MKRYAIAFVFMLLGCGDDTADYRWESPEGPCENLQTLLDRCTYVGYIGDGHPNSFSDFDSTCLLTNLQLEACFDSLAEKEERLIEHGHLFCSSFCTGGPE